MRRRHVLLIPRLNDGGPHVHGLRLGHLLGLNDALHFSGGHGVSVPLAVEHVRHRNVLLGPSLNDGRPHVHAVRSGHLRVLDVRLHVRGNCGDFLHRAVELLQRGPALAPAEPWVSRANVGNW